MNNVAVLAVLVFAILSTGCGTKGPLYLPKKAPATSGQSAPAPDPAHATAPVPDPAAGKRAE